jgi:hypothetical protein
LFEVATLTKTKMNASGAHKTAKGEYSMASLISGPIITHI